MSVSWNDKRLIAPDETVSRKILVWNDYCKEPRIADFEESIEASNKREDWEERWNFDWCDHGYVVQFTYWAYMNEPLNQE